MFSVTNLFSLELLMGADADADTNANVNADTDADNTEK